MILLKNTFLNIFTRCLTFIFYFQLKTHRQESAESGNEFLDVEYRPKKRKV